MPDSTCIAIDDPRRILCLDVVFFNKPPAARAALTAVVEELKKGEKE